MGATVKPVRGLAGQGGLGWIELTWQADSYHPLVDHFAVYGSTERDFQPGPANLITKTVYTRHRHNNLGPTSQTWYYRVVTVDAAGNASRATNAVRAASTDSVTVSGRPVAVIGQFDRKSLELALAPNGYAQYPTRFPQDADYTHGVSTPGADWPYLHPGPADKWAGSKAHTFRFRFTLPAQPTGDLALAVWLIDTHASNPGTLDVSCNDTAVAAVALEKGATKGSLQGDATAPGNPLRPSIVELTLPRAALRAGENVLTLGKATGSWHAYDALGVFEPRR
ncbi:polysaccharide lyase family protein [Goodfellowiella coeruleoviolacea]|uniref:Polysaccharide lyase family 4, domain III n=1 Tax=Goodfellowiella coeruleoviolacea TaxID=334858 RepID=A0AAE3GHV2_9PSEU|nr:polysaccharide lyase family protein [Goodfellowiella coeruleoviolacea]MCP2168476.1 Polysaccharide lyase family 4, domain III [Goodfellowiella coeruleoviolacea]